jgi:hypothetical protein
MTTTAEACTCSLGDWPHPEHADGLRTLPPTMCRLDYWSPAQGDWYTGHVHHALLYPARYVDRLAANGKVGRVLLLDTGEIIQKEPTPKALPVCPYCTDRHAAPHDGMCLL